MLWLGHPLRLHRRMCPSPRIWSARRYRVGLGGRVANLISSWSANHAAHTGRLTLVAGAWLCGNAARTVSATEEGFFGKLSEQWCVCHITELFVDLVVFVADLTAPHHNLPHFLVAAAIMLCAIVFIGSRLLTCLETTHVIVTPSKLVALLYFAVPSPLSRP